MNSNETNQKEIIEARLKHFLNPPAPKLRGKQRRLKEEQERAHTNGTFLPATPEFQEFQYASTSAWSPSANGTPLSEPFIPLTPSPAQLVYSASSTVPVSGPSATRRWAQYEWFYSDMDYPFFHPTINEFSLILRQELRCLKTQMSRNFWRVLRALMGPPRLFSKNYLQAQRSLLAAYRENIRRVRNGEDASHNLPFDWIPTGCCPGSPVLVLHPKSREICSAVISQIIRNDSVVRFFQTSLGTTRVPNVDIMPHAQAEPLLAPPHTTIPAGQQYIGSTYTYSKIINVDPSGRESIINNQIEMRILLESKEEILNTIQILNALVPDYQQLGKYSDFFIGRYYNMFAVLVDLETCIKSRHTSITRSSLGTNGFSPLGNGHHPPFEAAPLAPTPPQSEFDAQVYARANTILANLIRDKKTPFNSPPESVLRCLAFVLRMGDAVAPFPPGTPLPSKLSTELRAIITEFLNGISPHLQHSNAFRELANYFNSKLALLP